MSKIDSIFKKYEIICEFISKCFGENVEVILHDLRDIDHSGIKIYNNHVSGRSEGAPMTQFGINLLENKIYEREKFVNNYKGMTGGKILRSSTLFIKDDDENLIGMLCVNIDITNYIAMSKELSSLAYFGIGEDNFKNANKIADFPSSVKEMISQTVSEYASSAGYNIQRLTKTEKIEIVKALNDNGLFDLKGGLAQTAEMLNISEPTLYRYLNEIKKQNMGK
ncbi:helix-turn-helix transcriptional regulator [Fusobacterium sp. PH5-44]|uniref:helix-turn-helix transcriptional regulator n=1 Tax=unclassified Fusobacterium TaxID=2648384 RepID=UPI003D1DC497